MNRILPIFYRICVALLVVAMLPLQFVIAALIMATSGPPILFRQQRVGRGGKAFMLYKFRTMTHGAEKRKKTLQHLNEADGPVFKIRNDPRFTTIGKFLSHAGLDELPQLWNVLRGEMALIGPRPLPVAEAKKLKPWQRERHRIKPGIISPAVFTGNYHTDFDAWIKSDIAYIRQKSVAHDLFLAGKSLVLLGRLLVREIFSVLRRKEAIRR